MNMLKYFINLDCLAVLVVLICGTFRVSAVSPSPEVRPQIEVMSAITAADKYVREELKITGYYVAWASLTRSGDEMDRKWVTAWYPDNDDHELKSEYVVVCVEMRDDDIIAEKVDDPFGFREINKANRAIGLSTALKAAEAFSKSKNYLKDHYIYRVGLGKLGGSNEVCWIVCWWPEVHAADNNTWPVVVVNMKRASILFDGQVTWLARKQIYLPPRKKVLPPAGITGK